MTQMATRRKRSSRRACCRRLCASEKRCTGNFGARTGHRSYNPDTGRWFNRDPIGKRGGLNVYCFAGNTPIQSIDPDGQQAIVLPLAAAAAGIVLCAAAAAWFNTPAGRQATQNLTASVAAGSLTLTAAVNGLANQANRNGRCHSACLRRLPPGIPQCVLQRASPPPPGQTCWYCVYMCANTTPPNHAIPRFIRWGCPPFFMNRVYPSSWSQESCEAGILDGFGRVSR